MAADGGTPSVREPGPSEHSCSEERRPLPVINTKQIVSVPLHTKRGSAHRYVSRAFEMAMMFRAGSEEAAARWEAGADFALELFGILYNRVRVRQIPYHGGVSVVDPALKANGV